jgi:hypothetical protein
VRWQIWQRVTGSWVTVTGKRRESDLLICLYGARPAGVILHRAHVARTPRGRCARSLCRGRCITMQAGPAACWIEPGIAGPMAKRVVLYVSPDSTCWSALDPPVFRGSRCRQVLTPPADNYTRPFLAAAEPAVRRSVSRWSDRRRSLWPNDLYTRRRTATIAAPRKGPRTRSGVASHRQNAPR